VGVGGNVCLATVRNLGIGTGGTRNKGKKGVGELLWGLLDFVALVYVFGCISVL
jgi:hypothetical protein